MAYACTALCKLGWPGTLPIAAAAAPTGVPIVAVVVVLPIVVVVAVAFLIFPAPFCASPLPHCCQPRYPAPRLCCCPCCICICCCLPCCRCQSARPDPRPPCPCVPPATLPLCIVCLCAATPLPLPQGGQQPSLLPVLPAPLAHCTCVCSSPTSALGPRISSCFALVLPPAVVGPSCPGNPRPASPAPAPPPHPTTSTAAGPMLNLSFPACRTPPALSGATCAMPMALCFGATGPVVHYTPTHSTAKGGCGAPQPQPLPPHSQHSAPVAPVASSLCPPPAAQLEPSAGALCRGTLPPLALTDRKPPPFPSRSPPLLARRPTFVVAPIANPLMSAPASMP